MLSPEGNHYNGFFLNTVEDSPDADLTVHLATPTREGMLQVPAPSWRSDHNQESSPESTPNSEKSKTSPVTSPTEESTAPDFPVRRSSKEIIRAIEAANGNMGLFYKRSSAPLESSSQGQGKVNSLREQFEKIEREKIEQELLKEAAARGNSENVPIYV